jgi:hypothetical protein
MLALIGLASFGKRKERQEEISKQKIKVDRFFFIVFFTF